MRAIVVILQASTKKEDTMSTAMTRKEEDTRTLHVAFELGEKEWKLAMSPGFDTRPRLRSVRARGTARLLEILEKERQRCRAKRIVSCYEAGRDGFWLDRFLHAHGIDNRVVDSASIDVQRRARRMKTDRLDAQKLLTMLHREALGEKDVWSVVHVLSRDVISCAVSGRLVLRTSWFLLLRSFEVQMAHAPSGLLPRCRRVSGISWPWPPARARAAGSSGR
jgi:transposase